MRLARGLSFTGSECRGVALLERGSRVNDVQSSPALGLPPHHVTILGVADHPASLRPALFFGLQFDREPPSRIQAMSCRTLTAVPGLRSRLRENFGVLPIPNSQLERSGMQANSKPKGFGDFLWCPVRSHSVSRSAGLFRTIQGGRAPRTTLKVFNYTRTPG